MTAAVVQRPRLHFTPERNWLNDPNGLVFFGGRWHLYFQHNPNGSDWGDMSWGHASSADLVTWEEHSVALLHGEDEAIFSGSVVVDVTGSAGFGAGVLVALYTLDSSRGQAQALAWSPDGYSWTKQGVVLDRGTSDFRDPKVFRHADRWVMIAVEAQHREVHLFASDDLHDWRPLSVFGPAGAVEGIWECPDLFELDGRWVLTVSLNPGGPAGGSGQQYFVGDFDGIAFTAERWGWLDRGRDFYAGVTFDSAPGGERVMLGWMSNWDYAAQVPTGPWRGSMTLPRRLSLNADRVLRQSVAGGPWGGRAVLERRDEPVDGRLALPVATDCCRIDAVLRLGSARAVGLRLREGVSAATVVAWDGAELTVDRGASGSTGFSPSFASCSRAPLAGGETVALSIWVDASSIEVFAADGALVLTEQIFPGEEDLGVSVFAAGGRAAIESLTVTVFD
ncbi:levanase/fructan beta-fructosidase [Rathayibacter sp. PhB151]|uniref:glycoside hydrolase family 32 protein n=1 Tax=Rathayibacter sp. PhB151 TaxID=2485189 RepID=UPI001063EB6E|nr:glycoside hydrolase family 32 protein [Rathayibacter sp. PhB151]TDX81675.1 levanase/fructan beta-fructosidase [Rathayibacter sp. PhB151]